MLVMRYYEHVILVHPEVLPAELAREPQRARRAYARPPCCGRWNIHNATDVVAAQQATTPRRIEATIQHVLRAVRGHYNFSPGVRQGWDALRADALARTNGVLDIFCASPTDDYRVLLAYIKFVADVEKRFAGRPPSYVYHIIVDIAHTWLLTSHTVQIYADMATLTRPTAACSTGTGDAAEGAMADVLDGLYPQWRDIKLPPGRGGGKTQAQCETSYPKLWRAVEGTVSLDKELPSKIWAALGSAGVRPGVSKKVKPVLAYKKNSQAATHRAA